MQYSNEFNYCTVKCMCDDKSSKRAGLWLRQTRYIRDQLWHRYFLSIFKVSSFRLLSPNPYFQSIFFAGRTSEFSLKWSCNVKLVIRHFFKDLHLRNDCLIRTTIFNYHRLDTLAHCLDSEIVLNIIDVIAYINEYTNYST